MKAKKTFVVVFIILLQFTYACHNCIEGSGEITEKIQPINSFTELNLQIQAKVFLEQSDHFSLKIEADSNFLPYIEINQSGDKLSINSKKCFDEITTFNIYISFIDIDEITAGETAYVKNSGLFKTENLELKAEDAANLNLNLNVDNLSIKIEDSGNIDLSGNVNDLKVRLRDAAKLSAYKLTAKEADIEVRDAGNCLINVSQKLYGDVKDNGSINYKGNPKKVKTNISDSGTIKSK